MVAGLQTPQGVGEYHLSHNMDQHMDTTMSTPHGDNHPPRDDLQPRGNDTSVRTTPQSTTDEDDNEEETIPVRETISSNDTTVPNAPSSASLPLGNQVVTTDAQTTPLPSVAVMGAQPTPLSSQQVVTTDA